MYVYVYNIIYMYIYIPIPYYFVSQYMFSHALHDQVVNLPYRYFSSL